QRLLRPAHRAGLRAADRPEHPRRPLRGADRRDRPRGAGHHAAEHRRAPDLPALRGAIRGAAAEGDHRRRDGAGQDHRGARRDRPPHPPRRRAHPGDLPGSGDRELAARDQEQEPPHRAPTARPGPRRGARRVAARRRRRGHHLRDPLRLLADGPFEHLDTLVVDEAHKIKNPSARRSRSTLQQIRRAHHAILMTGTPIENRLEEFRTLIGYLDPDLARTAEGLPPLSFRQHISTTYLRRNQEDVLKELPELNEIEDWIEFSDEDRAAYEEQVLAGSFMGMRRAAMTSGT